MSEQNIRPSLNDLLDEMLDLPQGRPAAPAEPARLEAGEPVPGSEVSPLNPIQGAEPPSSVNEVLDQVIGSMGAEVGSVPDTVQAPESQEGDLAATSLSEPGVRVPIPSQPTTPDTTFTSMLDTLLDFSVAGQLLQSQTLPEGIGPPGRQAAEAEFRDRVLSSANSLMQGTARGVAQVPEWVAVMSSQIQRNVFEAQGIDPELAMRPEEFEGFEAGETVREVARKSFAPNPAYKDDFFTTKVPEGIGTTVVPLAAGVVGTMVGLPALLPAGAVGAMMVGAESYRDAIDSGATLEQAFTAANWGTMIGTTEGAPLASLLGKLDRGTGGSVRKLLRNVIVQGSEEAVQEAFQTLMTNFVASDIAAYDPERGIMVGVGEGAAVGFTVGGLLAFLGGLAIGGRRLKIDLEKEPNPTNKSAPRPMQGELFPLETFGTPPPVEGLDGQLEMPGIPPAQAPSQNGLALDVDPRQMEFFDNSIATQEQQYGLPFDDRLETPYGAGLLVVGGGTSAQPFTEGGITRLSGFIEAEATVAANPPQSVDIYQVDLSTLERRQVTADVAFIPEILTIEDPRVRFERGTSTADTTRALELVGEAREAGARGEETLSNALFEEAVDLGFRYTPSAYDGIVVAGALRPGQFSKLRQMPLAEELSPVFLGGVPAGENVAGRVVNRYLPVGLLEQRDRVKQLKANAQDKADPTFEEPVSPKQVKDFMVVAEGRGTNEVADALGRYGISFLRVDSPDMESAIIAIGDSNWSQAIELGVRFGPTSYNAGTDKPVLIMGEVSDADLVDVGPLPDYGRDDPLAPDQILGRLQRGIIPSSSGVTELLGQMTNFVDINGNSVVNLKAQGPVTVMAFRDAQENSRKQKRFERFLQRTAKQYERLMKEFGIKDQQIFIAPQKAPDTDPSGGFHVGNVLDGIHIINIDMEGSAATESRSSELSGWSSTAFHEFGHFMQHTLLANAPMETVDSLYRAFQRQSREASDASELEASIRLRGPDRIPWASPQTTFRSSGPGFKKWWDFDEWFAEQVSRWAFDSRRPVTLVDKFFKKVSRIFLRIIQRITGARPEELRAEAEMENWIADVAEQRRQGITSDSPAAVDFARLRSMAENAKVSVEEFGTVANFSPPASGASHHPKAAAEHGLLEFGDYSKNEFKAGLDWFNRAIAWGANVIQVAQKNQHLSGLQRYVESLDLAHNFKMTIITNADRRVSEWIQAVPRAKRKAFDRFLFDLTEMKYLPDGETDARQPTEAEELALAKRHGLDENDIAFSRVIREDFSNFLNQMEETFVLQARETFIENQDEMTREIARINSEFNALRKRPYIPMMRFGDFFVDVKDKDTGERLFFVQEESARAQKRRERILRKQFPNANINTGVLADQFRALQGLPPQMIRSIVQMQVKDLTTDQQNQLEALAFQFSPSQSFTKRLLRRKGVPGFDDDALRGYANYFFHASNNLTRVRFRTQLQNGIDQVRSSARKLSEQRNEDPAISISQTNKRGQIANFMQQHLDNFLNPRPDWAALRSLAFNWHLGFALDSAALNLTQVPMVAYPYLAARFSDAGAVKELGVATKDVYGIYKATGANPTKIASLPQDEFRALQRAMDEGFIDEGQASALAALAEGSNLQRALPGTPVGRFIRQASHWSGFLFQQAEMLNRRVVFRAAYRLAKNNPNSEYLTELAESKANELIELNRDGFSRSEALAYLAGKDSIRKTQFEYAAWARPRFMQGRAATVFTFFNFLQNMLFFARYSPGSARYLLILAGTAGLLGLPGFEDLFDISDRAYKELNKRGFLPGSGSLEIEVREFLNELGANPDLVLHGISSKSYGLTALGNAIGMPIPSVDFSKRVGIGRVVPGVEAVTAIGQDGFAERLGNVTEDVAGAAFAIPINITKALLDNHPDVFKRYARAMPRAIKNMVDSWRIAARGGVDNRTGATVVPFDVNDPDDLSEIIAKGLGFNPTRVSRRWDALRLQQETAMFWTTRKTMLMHQWDYAKQQGDKEALADVMKSVRRYNKEVPWAAMRLGPKNLRRSLIGRMRQRILTEKGLLSQRSLVPMSNEVLDLFPGLKEDLLRTQQLRSRSLEAEIVDEEEVR